MSPQRKKKKQPARKFRLFFSLCGIVVGIAGVLVFKSQQARLTPVHLHSGAISGAKKATRRCLPPTVDRQAARDATKSSFGCGKVRITRWRSGQLIQRR